MVTQTEWQLVGMDSPPMREVVSLPSVTGHLPPRPVERQNRSIGLDTPFFQKIQNLGTAHGPEDHRAPDGARRPEPDAGPQVREGPQGLRLGQLGLPDLPDRDEQRLDSAHANAQLKNSS